MRLRGIDRSPADLLLPKNILRYAMRLSDRHGHWRDLIAYLTYRYSGRILDLAERNSNLCFRYQSDGLDLQRVSYLPYLDIRVELRMLSYAARISMCALVVLMLEWERDSEERNEKYQEVTMQFEVSWKLFADSLVIFAKIIQKQAHPPPTT